MTRLSCFKDVEDLYNSIKPIQGERKSQDIRPIAERRYTWRRIKKYDDNCYALLDGEYAEHRTSEAYEKDMAPYLWTRDPETGDEFVRIRNGAGQYAHTGRYEFLARHTPGGMRFVSGRDGRHFIMARIGIATDTPFSQVEWLQFPLPKTMHTWDWDHHKPYGVDDGVFLLFKALGGGRYERVGEQLEIRSTTVDKELKAQWKGKIDSFYEYMAAIVPVMEHTWQARNAYRENIAEWCKVHYSGVVLGRSYGHVSLFGIPSGLARVIVTQEDHELRPALVSLIAEEIQATREVTDMDILRDMRSRYNRVMNKLLNMYEMKKG